MRKSNLLLFCLCAVCLLSLLGIGLLYFRVQKEPSVCALCGDGFPYHAPVLLNLSTGEKGELRVYQNDMGNPGKLDERQREGYGQLLLFDGFTAYQNGGHDCRVSLPTIKAPMNKSLFCKNCRELLSTLQRDSFTLIDLYDPNHFEIYPVQIDQRYVIRDYTVTIKRGASDQIEITVAGNISFDFYHH